MSILGTPCTDRRDFSQLCSQAIPDSASHRTLRPLVSSPPDYTLKSRCCPESHPYRPRSCLAPQPTQAGTSQSQPSCWLTPEPLKAAHKELCALSFPTFPGVPKPTCPSQRSGPHSIPLQDQRQSPVGPRQDDPLPQASLCPLPERTPAFGRGPSSPPDCSEATSRYP